MGNAEDPAGFSTIGELESVAAQWVREPIWAYIQGGAAEEHAVRRNREEFLRYYLRPRSLSGASAVDIRTSLLGAPSSAPFFVAPMAYAGSVHPDGEPAIARAAASEQVLSAFSTLSSYPLDAIARSSGSGARWFQLYLQSDVEVSLRLVRHAEASGFSAVMLTVDTPVLGSRDRQAKGGFAMEAPVPVGEGPEVRSPPRAPVLEGGVYRLRSEAGSTWEVVNELRKATHLPIVVKGILTAEDAQSAVAHGARGIVVSNHGGRQLGAAPATLTVLPEVVHAVRGRAEVYLDGGVRRGSDILVALALGAKAVGVGRPVFWALAVGGSDGVARYLSLLKTELATDMALIGRAKLTDLGPDLIARER